VLVYFLKFKEGKGKEGKGKEGQFRPGIGYEGPERK
jgi:hypothetical protein